MEGSVYMKDKSIKLNIFYTLMLLFIVFLIFLFVKSNYIRNKYDWHIYETGVYKVWDDYTGEDVVIAFLDTGMSVELQEMYDGRIVNPYNVIKDNNNIDDVSGHGTSMICVATCDYNISGIYGIAPSALVMPVIVIDEDGRISGENLSLGIIYAVDNNADIINLSSGSRIENDLVKAAIEYAEIHGVIVISAVGDYQEEKVLFPAKYDSVIAVQAQSKLGIKYLEASWGDDVDILIPGEFIRTLGINLETGKLVEKYESGSSISTAIMSGIIALMIDRDKSLELIDVISYVRNYENKNKFVDITKFIKQ